MAVDFIGAWHARVHGALAEGMAWLAGHDELPEPDGIIGDFVDVLCAMRFERSDLAHVIALLGKPNAYFQESGVRLATSALRDVDGAWDVLEKPLADMIARGPVDPWVLEALVDLLRRSVPSFQRPLILLYRALVSRHRQSASTIMRNRAIRPWDDLETHYEQHLLQVLEPGEREKIVLPILEAPRHERLSRDAGRDLDPNGIRSRKFRTRVKKP